MLDNVIYVEIGRGYENRIPLWITRRWLAEKPWTGRVTCWLGWHPWCLNSFPKRGAQLPNGRYELIGKSTWKCWKCGRVTE